MGVLSGVIADTPTFELILPSNGKKVEYRPFLVKEEKILLVASESKNDKEIYRAMQDVVRACTFGKLDINDSAMVDIEYLFIKIRAKSVGETAKPQLKCSKCQVLNEISINIDALEPKRDPKHITKIDLVKDKVVVEMRHPRFSDIERMQGIESQTERMFMLMALCIEKIHTPETTFVTKELDINEVVDFLEKLTQNQFKTISTFFETMPQLTEEVNYKCKACAAEETVVLKGAQDFF